MSGWQQIIFSALLCAPVLNMHLPARQHVAADVKSYMVFCAYGSPSFVSPKYHPELAVAVVDVSSPRKIENAAVSDVALIARNGDTEKMMRLAKVEIFGEPHFAGEGYGEYYLDTRPAGTTRPWNGTLPAGEIRLRVQAELTNKASHPEHCRVKVGPYVIEGPVNMGPWAN